MARPQTKARCFIGQFEEAVNYFCIQNTNAAEDACKITAAEIRFTGNELAYGRSSGGQVRLDGRGLVQQMLVQQLTKLGAFAGGQGTGKNLVLRDSSIPPLLRKIGQIPESHDALVQRCIDRHEHRIMRCRYNGCVYVLI